MKARYRLIRRGVRGGTFYCVDTKHSEDEARQIINAKNQALRQPMLNMQIAKAYLYGTENGIATRTWQQALDSLTANKEGDNQERWKRGGKEKPFDLIRDQIIIETSGETLLQVMRKGTVSTNIYLRRLHNFCLDMDWLLKRIIPKRQWPKIKFKERRGITFEEHQKILACEHNPELHDYYEILGSSVVAVYLVAEMRQTTILGVDFFCDTFLACPPTIPHSPKTVAGLFCCRSRLSSRMIRLQRKAKSRFTRPTMVRQVAGNVTTKNTELGLVRTTRWPSVRWTGNWTTTHLFPRQHFKTERSKLLFTKRTDNLKSPPLA
jgi:hypothetical protein